MNGWLYVNVMFLGLSVAATIIVAAWFRCGLGVAPLSQNKPIGQRARP